MNAAVSKSPASSMMILSFTTLSERSSMFTNAELIRFSSVYFTQYITMNLLSSLTTAKSKILRNTFPILRRYHAVIQCEEDYTMTIIEKLKSEINTLHPDDNKNAMLLRFGLADEVTHSR